MTDPPHGAPLGGRFVARGKAISEVELLRQENAAPPSGTSVPSATIPSPVPLPPKRLVEQRGIVLASLAPLPPRRPNAPMPSVPQATAYLEEPPSDAAAPPPDDTLGEDQAAPQEDAAEDAARAIDDTPAPVAGRLTSDRAPPHIEVLIERHAKRFDVPARLVRRVAWRESKFDPSRRHGPYWGLMQIRVDTARALGFRGEPRDLLDADVNMSYAVAYLANAYRVAGRDEKRAVMLYARGYYYEAKRKGMLGSLIRTATTEE
ncbi:lytic transglycosylase domain-containing protein [Ancylobacter novellus]|nr:lytic transglycosylase domain-containing protein [Ancylobacter novellus]